MAGESGWIPADGSLGGEAFEWLDEYFFSDSDTPDEAFDVICMTHPEDWEALGAVWANRPQHWREKCAYILGHGPVDDAVVILRKALFDADLDVAVEAALSYCDQRTSHPDKVPLDSTIVRRLQEIVAERQGKHLEEVTEVLRQVQSME